MPQFDDHFEKYLALTYRYLGIRNRSEKEIRDYLNKKNTPQGILDTIVQKLYEQKFLNDETFARSWVRSRVLYKPKAKRVLAVELKQKGIDQAIIEKILSEHNEELPDELSQAKQLIVKRISKMKDAPKQEIYKKVGAFLARRGYSWEVITRAIDDTLNDKV